MALSCAIGQVTRGPDGQIPSDLSYPFSFACRFRPDAVAGSYGLVCIGDASSNNPICALWITASNAEFYLSSTTSGPYLRLVAGAVSIGSDYSLIATAASRTDRKVLMTGNSQASDVTDAGAANLGPLERWAIGALWRTSVGTTFDGILWDVASWQANLSDDERASYVAGCSPRLIRPDKLTEHRQMKLWNRLYSPVWGQTYVQSHVAGMDPGAIPIINKRSAAYAY